MQKKKNKSIISALTDSNQEVINPPKRQKAVKTKHKAIEKPKVRKHKKPRTGQGMSTLAKNKRRYNSLIRKLDLYSQSPSNIAEHPTSRDVQRLQTKYETVHEYQKILRRFQKSVAGFNEKYYQSVSMPESHNTINKRTLEILKGKYEAWKKKRRSFVRKIPKEDDTILKNLYELLELAMLSLGQDGLSVSEGQRRGIRIQNIETLLEETIPPKGTPEYRNYLKYLKDIWDELKQSIDKYLYDSMTPEARNELFSKIVFLITRDGMKVTDIMDRPLYDKVY